MSGGGRSPAPDPALDPRRAARAIFDEAVRAVDPALAVSRAVRVDGASLVSAGPPIDLARIDRVLVIAAGKAASPMAWALAGALPGLPLSGLVVTKEGHGAAPPGLRLVEAGHPVPDDASVRAGEEALAIARSAGPRDAVFFLISGGASALLEAPRAPLSLADLRALTDALLRSGAPIGEVNALRKRASRVKGGGLALAAENAAEQRTLVLSDVIGGGPATVGSGPSLPDDTSWADALDVVARRLSGRAPTPALGALFDAVSAMAARGEEPETPRASHPAFARSAALVIGDASIAARAAASAAARLGYAASVETTTLEGEARDAGRAAARRARALSEAQGEGPRCLVFAGETTVTVRGHGRGGRNQEVALSAALALEGAGRAVVASLATDGVDGPTDAAGAIVDGASCARARAAGVDPAACLADNDAYRALSASGDLVKTGPTRTNVNDLLLILSA